MRRRVGTSLHDHQINLARQRVLVLCSGGVDSVAAVHILANLERGIRPQSLHVVHYDHGLRDGSGDLAAVRSICDLVAADLTTVDAPQSLRYSSTFQRDAREWRHACARDAAKLHGCNVIATGHHADDQVESFLLGLIGSSGLRAVKGMPFATEVDSITWLHPLLSLAKSEIIEYCRRHELPWAEDPSNESNNYRRNALRNTVIRPLVELHPGVGANIIRTVDELAGVEAVVRSLADALVARPDFGIADLQELHPDARATVVAAWLRAQGAGRAVSCRTIHAVSNLVDREPGSSVQLQGAKVSRDRYHLHYENRRREEVQGVSR